MKRHKKEFDRIQLEHQDSDSGEYVSELLRESGRNNSCCSWQPTCCCLKWSALILRDIQTGDMLPQSGILISISMNLHTGQYTIYMWNCSVNLSGCYFRISIYGQCKCSYVTWAKVETYTNVYMGLSCQADEYFRNTCSNWLSNIQLL